MKRTMILFSLSLVMAGCAGQAPLSGENPMNDKNRPVLLLENATVVTGNGSETITGLTVVVDGNRIEGIRPVSEARARFAAGELIDCSGLTILPGLIDAHGHLAGLGDSLDSVPLVSTTSIEEIGSRVAARAKTLLSPDEWVTGRGWDQNDWETKQFPTAADLDRFVSDRPVWIERVDGHASWANTAAMKAAGVTATSKDPEGGKILRDSAGNPTGVFIDTATSLIDSKVPRASRATRKARLLRAAQTVAANGLTAMHDAGVDDETIELYRELIDEGSFPIRVYAMLGDNEELLKRWFARGPALDHKGKLSVRSVKLYADGALGSRGAALLVPYTDDPQNSGLMIATPEHLFDVAKRARAAGFQVNAHAIGDRGTRNVIDAFAKAGVVPIDRFRIEHLQVSALEDFPRLAKHGIIASMQPTHATSDMYWAEARLGPQRVRGAYAWRKVLDAGGRLAFGSDFPVEDVNPFFGIYAAMTRKDQKDWPADGWYPEEKMSPAEALRGFALDAAYASFDEKTRGTIEAGKLADLTIVDRNPLTARPSDVYKTKVRYTIVDGKIVFDSAR